MRMACKATVLIVAMAGDALALSTGIRTLPAPVSPAAATCARVTRATALSMSTKSIIVDEQEMLKYAQLNIRV